eukprot:COSAG05_NODE_2833_length_2590_cov_1.761943_3_plen_122_part_00
MARAAVVVASLPPPPPPAAAAAAAIAAAAAAVAFGSFAADGFDGGGFDAGCCGDSSAAWLSVLATALSDREAKPDKVKANPSRTSPAVELSISLLSQPFGPTARLPMTPRRARAAMPAISL